jgi:hypothetical protein
MKFLSTFILVLIVLLTACNPSNAEVSTEIVDPIQTHPPTEIPEVTDTPEPTATTMPDPTEILDPIIATEILEENWFVDSFGRLNFIGRIKNTGNIDLELVIIYAEFRSPDGKLVAGEYGYASLGVLRVGEVSPFSLKAAADPDKWESYKVSVEAKEAKVYEPYWDFEVIKAESQVPADGAYEIVGEIMNSGSHNSKSVEVIGVLNDKNGLILGTEVVRPEENRLDAGESTSFTMTFEKIAEGEVESYELYVFAELR